QRSAQQLSVAEYPGRRRLRAIERRAARGPPGAHAAHEPALDRAEQVRFRAEELLGQHRRNRRCLTWGKWWEKWGQTPFFGPRARGMADDSSEKWCLTPFFPPFFPPFPSAAATC